MSQQRPKNAQAGPSRPLIQRPRQANTNTGSNAARPGSAVSPLSHAIHGALGGMGYRSTPLEPASQPSIPIPMPMAVPVLMPMGMMGMSYPAGLPMAPHYPPHPQAPYGYAPQAHYGSLPAPPIHPSHHPLPMNPQWYRQQPPPPSNQAAKYSGPSAQGPRPRTTNDGYTISSTYQAPTPLSSVSKPIPQRPPTSSHFIPHFNPRPSANSSSAGPPPPRPAPTRPLAASHPSAQSSYPCGLEGCSFKSNTRKVTREHEEDRHLMFEKGREPKPWKGTYQSGARIEGTSLSLDSPEAVAAWIEQRKQRWPSSKVVEEKEKQRDERIKAGLERPRNEYGAGARGGRGRGRGAERGRGRGGPTGMGRGGVRGAQDRNDAKRVKREGSEGSSSSDSDSDSSGSTSNSDEETSDDEGDDGPPEEMSTTGPKKGKDGEEEAARREFVPRIPCRHFLKGRCAAGDACTFLHATPPEGTAPPPRPRNTRKRPHPASSTPYNPFARSDPFAQLAERDWKHLVSNVLQVLQFLADNEWLKGVEMRRGEIEEQGGIEEVQMGVVEDGVGEQMVGEDTEFPLEGQLDERGRKEDEQTSPEKAAGEEVSKARDAIEVEISEH